MQRQRKPQRVSARCCAVVTSISVMRQCRARCDECVMMMEVPLTHGSKLTEIAREFGNGFSWARCQGLARRRQRKLPQARPCLHLTCGTMWADGGGLLSSPTPTRKPSRSTALQFASLGSAFAQSSSPALSLPTGTKRRTTCGVSSNLTMGNTH